MRIQVRLPKIQPTEYQLPEQCPYEDCSGDQFKPHGRQGEAKAVRDTDHWQVISRRYRCITCGRTFRIYPSFPRGLMLQFPKTSAETADDFLRLTDDPSE